MALDFTEDKNSNFNLLWKTILLVFLPLIGIWMLYNALEPDWVACKKETSCETAECCYDYKKSFKLNLGQ